MKGKRSGEGSENGRFACKGLAADEWEAVQVQGLISTSLEESTCMRARTYRQFALQADVQTKVSL